MYFKKTVVTCLIVTFILLLGLSFYYLYNAPVVGAFLAWDHETGHGRVLSSQAWSSFRTGDEVIRIGDLKVGYLHLLTDNIYLKDRAELFAWLAAKQAIFRILNQPSVTLLVLRDGRELSVSLAPRKAGPSFLRSLVFLHFIAGTIFFLIGIVVFSRKGSGKVGFVFLMMCLTLMFVYITNATSLMSEIVYQPRYLSLMNLINIAALPLGNALLFHMTLLLPRKRRIVERVPWFVPLVYGVCILVIATLRIPAINFLTAVFSLLMIVSIVYGFFAYREPVERQQMKWVLAGFIFGVGPWALINAVPLLITGHRLVNDTVLAAFVVLIPLFIAFAIWKYRLMDIDALLEGSFVYGITILLLGVTDAAILGLLEVHFGTMPLFNNIFLSLAIVVSLYVVLRDRIRLLVRKAYGRAELSEAETIAMLNERASGRPPEEILQSLADVVRESFHPKKTVLAARADEGSADILGLFEGHAGLIRLWEKPRFAKLLSEGFYLALVMSRGEKADAVLMLGGLQNRKFYARQDLAVLDVLRVQARVLYENALLYEANIRECGARLMEEKRHQKEKETILKDLHDGIGGIAANIHLLAETALAAASPSPDDTRRTFATIAELSQKGLFEVSSFLQSLDPAEATFSALLAELRHLGGATIAPHGMRFMLETSGLPTGDGPGGLFFLNVLRIYQEALTNIIKHAHAGAVTVQAVFERGLFALSICDDGIGLSPEGGHGRGIKNMHARAKDIGGRLSIVTEKGTQVRLEAPLSISGSSQTEEGTVSCAW